MVFNSYNMIVSQQIWIWTFSSWSANFSCFINSCVLSYVWGWLLVEVNLRMFSLTGTPPLIELLWVLLTLLAVGLLEIGFLSVKMSFSEFMDLFTNPRLVNFLVTFLEAELPLEDAWLVILSFFLGLFLWLKKNCLQFEIFR